MEPQVSGQVPAPGGNLRRLLPDCPGKQCAKTLPNLRIRKLRLRKRICINPWPRCMRRRSPLTS